MDEYERLKRRTEPKHPYSPVPVKIMPFKHESMLGFVNRLAQANRYPSPTWITDLEPLFDYARSVGMAHKALKRMVGFQGGESPFNNEHSVNEVVLSTKRLRICQDCMAENGFHDYIWSIRFASACPYHGIQLIDACPTCLAPLRWERVPLDICVCGTDLKKAEKKRADNAIMYFNAKIWMALGRNIPEINIPGIPDGLFDHLEAKDLLTNYRYLSFLVMRCRHRDRYIKSVAEAIETFEMMYPLLSDWPLGFFRFLDGFRNADGTFNGEGLQQAFGLFYRRLYTTNYQRLSQAFLKDMFESYISENWPGIVDKKYGRVNPKITCSYTPLSNTIKTLHISRGRLNKLIDLNMILADRKPRPSGRSYTLLKQCEIKKLAFLSLHLVNKNEVCQLLGIGKLAFDVLIEQKLIRPIVQAGDHGFGEWWCDKREIKAFLHELLAVMPKEGPRKGAIPFGRMCQAYLTHRSLLPVLLRSILKGETKVAGMVLDQVSGDFNLSSIYFELGEIKRFRKESINTIASSYTIPEAATMLGLKQEVMYHLVNSGLLVAYIDPEWPKRGRQVTLAAMNKFEKKFVALREITRQRNACSRAIMILFSKKGIKPAIGGGTDGCRQVFYLREDICSI